jgi:hypothetical protein
MFAAPATSIAFDFNRIQVDGLDPNALERRLSGFEARVGVALQKIAMDRAIADETAWNAVLNLMALLSVRNPRCREQMRRFREDVARLVMDSQLATRERYEAVIREIRAGPRGADIPEGVDYESVREFHRRGEYQVEIPTGAHLAVEFHVFEPVLMTLAQRRWLLCVAPRGCGGYVTTDHPVSLTTTDGEGPSLMRPLSYETPGTTVAFPVTRDLLALGTFSEGENGSRVITPLQVAYFNGLIASFAQRQIFAADDRYAILLSGNTSPLRGAELGAFLRSRKAARGNSALRTRRVVR